MSSPYELSDDMPVYVISVAAQLSGMHPQTLREYERRGLVSPGRSGDNLTVTVPVTISELALGAEIKVPTHRGPAVTVRVPPGTPNGQVFRVPGRGVRKKDGTLGALLATVDITVPQDLNSKARSALEDLRIATSGTDPREELLKRARQN